MRADENKAYYALDQKINPEGFLREAQSIIDEYKLKYTDPVISGQSVLEKDVPFVDTSKMQRELDKFFKKVHTKEEGLVHGGTMGDEGELVLKDWLVEHKVPMELTAKEVDMALEGLGGMIYGAKKNQKTAPMAERLDALMRKSLYGEFTEPHPSGGSWADVKTRHSKSITEGDKELQGIGLTGRSSKQALDPELDMEQLLSGVTDLKKARSAQGKLALQDPATYQAWKDLLSTQGYTALQTGRGQTAQLRVFGGQLRGTGGVSVKNVPLWADPMFQMMSVARGPIPTAGRLGPSGVGVTAAGMGDEEIGTNADRKMREISRMSPEEKRSRMLLLGAIAEAEEK